MAVNEMGLSTLGITLGYAIGTTKPSSFTQLDRIVSIGEFSIQNETIDVSCLEDLTSKFVRGRGTISDTIPVVVNWTDEVEAQWEAVLSAFAGKEPGQAMWWEVIVPGMTKAGKEPGQAMWWEVIVPGMTKAAFFKAQPPTALPVPSMEQNVAFTNTMNLVAEDLIGWDTKVAFS